MTRGMLEPDWAARRLCDDGACTGIIAPSGRCNQCGLAASDYVPVRDDSDAAAEADEAVAPTHEAGDDDRTLCPDGGCTGLLGVDGRCRSCGRDARDLAS